MQKSETERGEMPSVNVYGSGRLFVVVPRVRTSGTNWVEATPVHRVNIILGRSVVVPLAQALRDARTQSEDGLPDEEAIWGGDDGRWWDHRLMCVRLTWTADHVIFAPQPLDGSAVETNTLKEFMPADLSADKLATRLIEYLGEKLHVS